MVKSSHQNGDYVEIVWRRIVFWRFYGKVSQEILWQSDLLCFIH